MQYRGAKYSVTYCRVERQWSAVVLGRQTYWRARWEAILEVSIRVDEELARRGVPRGRFIGRRVVL